MRRPYESIPWSRVLLDGRGAVRVEGVDGLEAPRLSLLPLRLRPDDRLPVGGEHQPRTGVRHLDAVRAGLPAVERLYLNELMRTYDANEGVRAFLEKRAPEWRDE